MVVIFFFDANWRKNAMKSTFKFLNWHLVATVILLEHVWRMENVSIPRQSMRIISEYSGVKRPVKKESKMQSCGNRIEDENRPTKTMTLFDRAIWPASFDCMSHIFFFHFSFSGSPLNESTNWCAKQNNEKWLSINRRFSFVTSTIVVQDWLDHSTASINK